MEGIPIEYSYGCPCILIEYSNCTKGLRPPKLLIEWMVFLQNILMAAQEFLQSIPMAAQVPHPPSYGSNGCYSYRIFLWLPRQGRPFPCTLPWVDFFSFIIQMLTAKHYVWGRRYYNHDFHDSQMEFQDVHDFHNSQMEFQDFHNFHDSPMKF